MSPFTQRFLAQLQHANARYQVLQGVDIGVAASNASELVESLEAAINDGTLIDMGWVDEPARSRTDPSPPAPALASGLDLARQIRQLTLGEEAA